MFVLVGESISKVGRCFLGLGEIHGRRREGRKEQKKVRHTFRPVKKKEKKEGNRGEFYFYFSTPKRESDLATAKGKEEKI